jgi:TPR repeat protein
MCAGEGNATAQYAMGNKYVQGHGVVQSDEKAVQWLRKAADQGSVSTGAYAWGRHGCGEERCRGGESVQKVSLPRDRKRLVASGYAILKQAPRDRN